MARWKADIEAAGAITKGWIPENFNTIADYGSRSVQPNPDGALTTEERHETYLYAVEASSSSSAAASSQEEGAGQAPPVVQGHLHIAPILEHIVAAQETAGIAEKLQWQQDKRYHVVQLAGRGT